MSIKTFTSAFRLGDVRGIYPNEIDEPFAFSFGQAFAAHFNLSGSIAVGRDMRDSSLSLQQSLIDGLSKAGLKVLDLGLCTTELGYFASTQVNIRAVIIVTASHNPANYAGFKCVLDQGKAVTFHTGLSDVMSLMLTNYRTKKPGGSQTEIDLLPAYIDYVSSKFSPQQWTTLPKIALNGLNGTAVTLAEQLAKKFELDVLWFRKKSGPFPSEGADPTKPALVKEMQEYMSRDNFGLGIAWDGDCDRCVFYDASGKLIPTYYIVGIFSQHFLQRHKAATIVFDGKLRWNTLDIIKQNGGIPHISETGHAFMKRHMKLTGAVYGGELSAHHYFSDFFHCDSGMFAWLTLLEWLVNNSDQNLEALISQRRSFHPSTPEISLSFENPDTALEIIRRHYSPRALDTQQFDGVSYVMPGDWRFCITPSKTENVVRFNFESRGNADDLLQHADDLFSLMDPLRISDEEINLTIQ
ncbi:MAG: phosphomannomutase [Candidatus Azotimanducaceae bacterium]